MLEMNTLMTELKERRLGALEATALLQRVMAEIDVAVLAFDDAGALRLVNAGGERLLGQPSERLLGRRAEELGLAGCLEGDAPRVMELALGGPARPLRDCGAGCSGRAGVRTSSSCSPT